MYAGRGETVPLPTTGHLHILKSRGYVYWENDKHWDKNEKKAVDSRRIIGKLDPDDPSRMYPNNTYKELFGSQEPVESHSSVLAFGPWAALSKAAEKVGCLTVLKKIFPWEWDRVLAMAVYSICAENMTAQHLPYWEFRNYCGLDHPMSSQEVTDIYDRLSRDPKKIEEFMSDFRNAYIVAMKTKRKMIVGFDSTNQSVSSSRNMLSEFGHAKQNASYPQINTALFADEKTGIPLFYEHFIGSILDKSQTPFTVEKARSLGFEKMFLMMDRGCFSSETAASIAGMDLEFGLMTPSHIDAAKDLISTQGASILNNEEYYISSENIYGASFPDTEILGGKYTAYLYFDSNRANDERNHIHLKVKKMIQIVTSRKRFSQRMLTDYSPWLIIERTKEKDPETGRYFTVTVNPNAVQKELATAGFFVIVSNTNFSAEEMIKIARMCDVDEKNFRRLKMHFEMTSPYTHSLATYEGKMFAAFIALIIIESYRWFLRDELRDHSSETLATTLGELAKYEIRQKPDGTWMPMYAATRRSKEILKCLDLSEDQLQAAARSVTMKS